MEHLSSDFLNLDEIKIPELLTSENSVFFWKIDSPFSQWSGAEFEINGINFNCAEQYMMYSKAIFFGDDEIAQKILATDDPSEQKQLGRQVKDFDSEIWDEVCNEIVYEGNLAKFTQNEELQKSLFATDNKILVEINPKDKIWAIGLGQNDERINIPAQWQGENKLGKILMIVRDELISSSITIFSEESLQQ